MEMQIEFDHNSLVTSMMSLVGFAMLLLLYNALVWKPERLRSKLRNQGISGPPPTFLLGNIREIKNSRHQHDATPQLIGPLASHDCASTIFPFFHKWKKKYGQVYTFCLGNLQILYVDEPEMLREITTCTSMDFGKPSYQQKEKGPLLGQGVITSNGTIWARQRKIIAPELYMDKVKGMTTMIGESATCILNLWTSTIEKQAQGGGADIKVDDYMKRFSGDVISKACFGSNYAKGEEIFSKLTDLQEVLSRNKLSFGIPGMRYLPTKSNREAWALEKEVRKCILEVVKKRKESSHEKDLLQIILEVAENSDITKETAERFIVDNCKNIYLAGYETTAITATWCLMLLASNQDWQDRVRAETLEICQGKIPDYDMLRKMKQLTMVIQETLRLYTPAAVMSREALEDMRFGTLYVPKGVNLWVMILSLHTNPDVWGPDSYKFNPERFANGISGACKVPHLYMPFGAGPRVCIGRDLAMTELKMILSLILSKFSFSLSPKYIHAPALKMVIEPQHGVHLLVNKLSS